MFSRRARARGAEFPTPTASSQPGPTGLGGGLCIPPERLSCAPPSTESIGRETWPAPKARSRRSGWSNNRSRSPRAAMPSGGAVHIRSVRGGRSRGRLRSRSTATSSVVTTSALQRCAIASSFSTVPILRTLHTGCTATACDCCWIVMRGSTTSCTNSMLSCTSSRPAKTRFIRYAQGLVSNTIGQRPPSLAPWSADSSSSDLSFAASFRRSLLDLGLLAWRRTWRHRPVRRGLMRPRAPATRPHLPTP